MSNDLISRASLIENLRKFAPEHYNALINDLIMKEPVAFDKEKVIEELSTLRQAEYDDSDEEPEFTDIDDILGEGKSQGRYQAYSKAIKVVEKGGIE